MEVSPPLGRVNGAQASVDDSCDCALGQPSKEFRKINSSKCVNSERQTGFNEPRLQVAASSVRRCHLRIPGCAANHRARNRAASGNCDSKCLGQFSVTHGIISGVDPGLAFPRAASQFGLDGLDSWGVLQRVHHRDSFNVENVAGVNAVHVEAVAEGLFMSASSASQLRLEDQPGRGRCRKRVGIGG